MEGVSGHAANFLHFSKRTATGPSCGKSIHVPHLRALRGCSLVSSKLLKSRKSAACPETPSVTLSLSGFFCWLWLLPPDNRWRLRPLNGYWQIGGNKATKWLLTPISSTISHKVATDTEGGPGHVGGSPDHMNLRPWPATGAGACRVSLALIYMFCGRWVVSSG